MKIDKEYEKIKQDFCKHCANEKELTYGDPCCRCERNPRFLDYLELKEIKKQKKTNWAIVRLLKLMSVPEGSREIIAITLKNIDKMIDSIE